VESKGERLELFGDLINVVAVQFENPSVTIQFDTDSKATAAAPKAAYAEAAKSGSLIALAHVSFPGLGNLRAVPGGKSYIWVQLNYSSLK
jgi:hypothetical protein